MTVLPRWADTPLGRELLAAIRRDPPATYVRSNRLPSVYGGYPGIPEERFTGKLVSRLRKMREEWVDREMALLDQQYHATHRWDEEASRAVLGSESADDLIRRVLVEGEERAAA
jgi:hypothetical protein